MKKDASALCVLLVIALLSAVFSPPESAPKAEPPPDEIRIGDVAEVEEIDPVKDANAEKGWYKKTKGGWIFWPENTVDESKPPKAELAAFMGGELTQSLAGLALLAFPFFLIAALRKRSKRKANDKDMKRISGVSQVEFQALIRKLSGMEQILHNLTPDNAEKENGGKKRWI